jgi:hypothetical protein
LKRKTTAEKTMGHMLQQTNGMVHQKSRWQNFEVWQNSMSMSWGAKESLLALINISRSTLAASTHVCRKIN